MICYLSLFVRYLFDIEEKMKKADYYHNILNTTNKVLLVTFDFIEQNILNTYESVGNPAASRKSLVNVWIRLVKSLKW